MAPVIVNLDHVREFKDADSFHRWLGEHHASAPEVWIKIHKVGSGLPTITAKEAIEVCLCWGWIDGIRKGFDERSFLQRYTPRRPKSVWSRINVDNVQRLIEEGRMTEHGLRQVEAAKADGRWERAYTGQKDAELPADLAAAIEAESAAAATLEKLTAQNRFALVYRVNSLKTEAARKRKIEALVEMLKRGEAFYPQRGL
ncbi:MAG TPA: YdeI/OmpD-associated family protein [Trueperaceae bacterium]